MPRKPRLHAPGGFYHVILRGNHREAIFFCSGDRDLFSNLVSEAAERFRMRVHAYCWMTNHVHLLMQVSEVPLGRAMMRIASRFARSMQKRRRTTGHFFERRHRAILVDADAYLLELIRYIHLNPVRAGITTDPTRYPWSGHLAYLGAEHVPWLTTDFALSMLANEISAARGAYARFIMAGIAATPDPALTQGHPHDARVLGPDRFLANLPAVTPIRSDLSIEQLTQRICRQHDIDPAVLASPRRVRSYSRIRALILHHAIHSRIATPSDVARRFNRSLSAIIQSLEHYRVTEPQLFQGDVDPGQQ